MRSYQMITLRRIGRAARADDQFTMASLAHPPEFDCLFLITITWAGDADTGSHAARIPCAIHKLPRLVPLTWLHIYPPWHQSVSCRRGLVANWRKGGNLNGTHQSSTLTDLRKATTSRRMLLLQKGSVPNTWTNLFSPSLPQLDPKSTSMPDSTKTVAAAKMSPIQLQSSGLTQLLFRLIGLTMIGTKAWSLETMKAGSTTVPKNVDLEGPYQSWIWGPSERRITCHKVVYHNHLVKYPPPKMPKGLLLEMHQSWVRCWKRRLNYALLQLGRARRRTSLKVQHKNRMGRVLLRLLPDWWRSLVLTHLKR